MTVSMKTIVSALIAGALLIGIIVGGMWFNNSALGSAPSGVPATIATTTVSQAVTAGVVELLFATSSCSSRIIGTQGTEIRLTFSDNTGARPAVNVGFPQTASTTVAYDSGLYGCGAVYVYPYSTGVLTVSETN